MAKSNRFRPFTPDPAQMALKPEVSGNAINGLGESTLRQPRMVYWAPNPDTIAHGAMQRWFYQVDPTNPHLAKARERRAQRLAEPMPEIQGAPLVRSPQAWTTALAELANTADFDRWGVAAMDSAWVYEGQHVSQQRIIVVGVAHDYASIATAPEATASAEVIHQYGRAASAAKLIAGWLRQQGWDAEPLTGPI